MIIQEQPTECPLSSNPGGAGAETGAGGRMRDTHATGIGSIMGAGTAGYCVGNLGMEGTPLPGEDPSFAYPDSLAPPLQVPPARTACHPDPGGPWSPRLTLDPGHHSRRNLHGMGQPGWGVTWDASVPECLSL